MPDLSEFVEFVAVKSGVAKPGLVEQDILIHRLLKALCDSPGFGGEVRVQRRELPREVLFWVLPVQRGPGFYLEGPSSL